MAAWFAAGAACSLNVFVLLLATAVFIAKILLRYCQDIAKLDTFTVCIGNPIPNV